MKNVDPSKVIRRLAERIADEAISRAITEVALTDLQEENTQLKVDASFNNVADGQQ